MAPMQHDRRKGARHRLLTNDPTERIAVIDI